MLYLLMIWALSAAPPPADRVVPSSTRSTTVVERTTAALTDDLSRAGLRLGAPVFLRLFKAEGRFEVWIEGEDGRFVRFRDHPICAFSGTLGPKEATGDHQAPEGAYFVPPRAMNPSSAFHLSFDLGYPNALDRAHGRTGSFLMVHGGCVSVGCYALTDAVIEEVWTLMDAAFAGGQPYVRVHALPFRPTAENLTAHRESRWSEFWRDLAAGWEMFQATRRPPDAAVKAGRYVFTDEGRTAADRGSAAP
jgi:murein L,D-transpeptidase YafK